MRRSLVLTCAGLAVGAAILGLNLGADDADYLPLRDNGKPGYAAGFATLEGEKWPKFNLEPDGSVIVPVQRRVRPAPNRSGSEIWYRLVVEYVAGGSHCCEGREPVEVLARFEEDPFFVAVGDSVNDVVPVLTRPPGVSEKLGIRVSLETASQRRPDWKRVSLLELPFVLR